MQQCLEWLAMLKQLLALNTLITKSESSMAASLRFESEHSVGVVQGKHQNKTQTANIESRLTNEPPFIHKLNESEHLLLLTQVPLNSTAHREKLTHMMLETFNTQTLLVTVKAVLSLQASERITGIVLDLGESVSHTVSFYEHFCLAYAVLRLDLTGRDVTEYMQQILVEQMEGRELYCEVIGADVIQPQEGGHTKCALILGQEPEQIFEMPDGVVFFIGVELLLFNNGAKFKGKREEGDNQASLDMIDVHCQEAGTMRFELRASLVDQEPGITDVIKASPMGALFKLNNMCFGASRAGNDWAKSHYTEGAALIDEAVDIRRETESYDWPQGFQLTQDIKDRLRYVAKSYPVPIRSCARTNTR